MNKRLFTIGDIHGCFDSLKELVQNKILLQKSDKLILLGDYIDRGDKSKEVIDYIIELREKEFDIIPLMGNHEAMLLDAYDNEKNTLSASWSIFCSSNLLIRISVNSSAKKQKSSSPFFDSKSITLKFCLFNDLTLCLTFFICSILFPPLTF
jgi:predicted MPP superfamily phosphohydrolase